MNKTSYRSLSEINVTSLVDVSLVLLIIFMITAPLIKSGMEVNLPDSSADELKIKEGIVVTLTADGSVYLDQEKVAGENFADRLLKNYIARGGQPVLIKADKVVPYGQVAELMGSIKEIGISKVGLMVEPGKKR